MINLMFCGNDKVLDGMIISLLSIVKHCKKELNVYVLTMDLTELSEKYRPITESQADILDSILKRVNPKSRVILIDITKYFKDEMLNSANIKTHYTPYILVRLFSDKIEQIPDKILYLDSDIVVYKNIEPLYNMKIDKYDYAACIDEIGKTFISKDYVNSGVLLMNMKKLREENALEKCRKMVVDKKMLLPDQTALNKVCKDKKYIERKYNEQKSCNEDTVIRHYSMTMKFMFTLNREKRKIIKENCSILKFIPFLKFLNIKPWNIEGIHKIYKIHDFDDIINDYQEIKGEIK